MNEGIGYWIGYYMGQGIVILLGLILLVWLARVLVRSVRGLVGLFNRQ